jgi:HEAT repeat protein
MTDPDACVRRVAAALSARVHATDLAIALRSELASSSTDVRETAVLALGYAGKGNAEPALAAAARDADVRVRRLAAWGLGRSDNAAALAPLDRLIGDDDPLVRVNAALAMGSLSRRDAVPVLVGVLRSDRDPHVRRAAAAALGRIE